MSTQNFKLIFLSIAILSFFVLMPVNDSFGSEITYSDLSGTSTLSFRDITFTDPTPTLECSFDKDSYQVSETAFFTVDDFSENLGVTALDFFPTVITQPSSITTVDAIETGPGTRPSTKVFDLDFEVTDTIESLVCSIEESAGDSFISWEIASPDAARAQVKISGFTGDLTFSDRTIPQDESVNNCFTPVTGVLVINGTLNVQPKIWISYANANFTGPAEGNTPFNISMYYKQTNSTSTQSWEKITLPVITDGPNMIDQSETGESSTPKTIKSKNTKDTGTETLKGILDPGGWVGITDYQGEYVLAIDTGCGGGGGGGLVRPSLVVNALAGIGGGTGGGAGGLPPLVELSELVKYSLFGIPLEIEEMVLNHDSTVPLSPMEIGLFENFDYPMTINDKGFVLGGFTSKIQTQTIKTDSPTVIKFIVYDLTKIQHFSFYTNLRDANSQIHQSDTQILYNDGQPLQVIDPNGFFSDVTVTINEINENKKEAVFEITFAKPMAKSDIIIRIWDPYFNSRDAFILDAFEVVSEIAEEPPTPTFEEPVIEELQSQSIPKWIKNNAAWWSDQQISDSDFVSGIEYLIKNGIINVSGVEVGVNSASTEIPEWIKNNAGWWADSLITDGDFTEAMQWLVTNGVIQI